MKIAFTLCSNNYLAQAKVLGISLKKHNPEYYFIIGLIDKYSPHIDYTTIGFEIILLEDIGLLNIEKLWQHYNIVELNTCIKPTYFKHIFKKYEDTEFVLFFDPDIMIYSELADVESQLIDHDFVLIPHILNSIPINNKRPNDYDFLNYGLYNLGFLALKNSFQIVNNFLPWWEERTLKLGFDMPSKGLFVDQIWFNLVPLFFKRVSILSNPGYNVAPWNLQERNLEIMENGITVNGTFNLVFYHFSSYKYYNALVYFYNYDNNLCCINSNIEKLYLIYHNMLIDNEIITYSKINCYYSELRENYYRKLKRTEGEFLYYFKKLIITILPYGLVKLLKLRTK